jgi:hypothetical protein
MVVMGAVVVVRHRDWRIAIAFTGLLTLPILRGYAYLKLYGLMPAVVALAAAGSAPAIVLGAVGARAISAPRFRAADGPMFRGSFRSRTS